MLSPTDCCCEPTYTRYWISGFWPLTLGAGGSSSPSCSPGRSTRPFRLAISPNRQQPGSGRARRHWRSLGNGSVKPKTTGSTPQALHAGFALLAGAAPAITADTTAIVLRRDPTQGRQVCHRHRSTPVIAARHRTPAATSSCSLEAVERAAGQDLLNPCHPWWLCSCPRSCHLQEQRSPLLRQEREHAPRRDQVPGRRPTSGAVHPLEPLHELILSGNRTHCRQPCRPLTPFQQSPSAECDDDVAVRVLLGSMLWLSGSLQRSSLARNVAGCK